MKDLNLYEFFHIRSDQIIGGNILARCSRPLIPISAARHYTSILLSCRPASIRCSRCRQALFQDRSAALSFTGVRGKDYLISKGRPYRPGILVCTKCQSFPAPERGEMYRYCQPHRGSKNSSGVRDRKAPAALRSKSRVRRNLYEAIWRRAVRQRKEKYVRYRNQFPLHRPIRRGAAYLPDSAWQRHQNASLRQYRSE